MTEPLTPDSDIVIVGGGHNGLAAAAYLARAGLSVTVLERLPAVGGAAVSTAPFAGVDARVSRYSYLVSLLPPKIIDDLGLKLSFARRRYSSYTPVPGHPEHGLLIDGADLDATAASFASIGANADAELFHEFYRHCRMVTEPLWRTVTEPLLRRSEARALVPADTWAAMIERPIGEIITRHLQNDVVRGVIETDALIGTFARALEPDLSQNVCFLYHVLGQGDGSWNIPIGGMGAVTDELLRAALDAGATIVTDAEVTGVRMPRGASAAEPAAVTYVVDGVRHTLEANTVLANIAPAELDRLLGGGGTGVAAESGARESPSTAAASVRAAVTAPATTAATESPALVPPRTPEGAQVKVNLLLSRLPRLRDAQVTPEQAFGGTFHINETYTQLDVAYLDAAAGRMPDPVPCEIYSHSLADPSILSPELQAAGVQTLTVFALHVPHRLAIDMAAQTSLDGFRELAQAAVLASLNSVLAEPIEDCLLRDANGEPCIETKTTLDIEAALRMPGGNIFHGPLSWPFVDDDAPLDTPAERWGVATGHAQLLLCGSGARRGGAVSALGGHNAAMAVLEQRELSAAGTAGHPAAATSARVDATAQSYTRNAGHTERETAG